MLTVSSVAYPHCFVRYLERRLGFNPEVSNMLRKNSHVIRNLATIIRKEINTRGRYIADTMGPNG